MTSTEAIGDHATRGISFTREQVEAWAGRKLTDDQMQQLEDTLPNSTFPATVSLVLDSMGIEYPAECPSCREPFDELPSDCWLSDLHGQRSREGRFMLLAGHRQSADDPDAFGPYDTYALAVQFAREQVTEGDWDPTGVTLTFSPIKETA